MAKEGPHGGSSSASSAPVTGNNFDVFLSFRGSDTRYGFTDVLYNSLTGAGVRTFRDEEELFEGEYIKKQLPEAIKLSKIGIPILSKGYASSKWCLRELAHMIEWLKDGMIIMPVFFHISAWDVKMKDEEGIYAADIKAHEKKGVDQDTIQKWVDALKEVTSLKGRQLNDDNGQGEFATMMVSKVMKKLRKAKLNLSDKLVGIEDHLTKLRRMLDTDSSDVRMIVISGIPGIGKTTLAKSLYNDICHLFDRCSFLGDIQETSAKKGLVALQNQLVSDIIRRDLANFYSVEEGVSFLKDRFSTLKVLILLDDLHEKTQLEALVGSLNWFGSGSRIIITTKYKLVLSGREVTETYDVTEMNHGDALKLFCRHTFAKDCPEHDYDDLSERIVSATGRLPLALELAGSHLSLFRDKKEVWEALLEKLEKLPDDDVQKKLKIHYELLSSSQRHILLDIACFLVGEDKRIASYMWKELDLFPSLELEKLCLMSMVKIGDDNRMWMHDQLRKLGRQIVQDNRTKHGNNSRLWATEARKIFKQDESQTKVEALCLDMDNTEQKHMDDRSQTCLTADKFKRVPNLRLLILDHFDIKEEDFRNLLSKLLWLRWHGCPRAFNVKNLNLEDLVILDLSWSKVTEGWEGWKSIKLSRNLKVLILRGCVDLIQTPNFSNFKALEMLILEYCSHLVRIDPSIGQLQRLQILDLKFCTDLSNLPRELDSLEALRELRLDGTCIEDIPVSEDMKHLKTLSACNCKSLAQVSSEIGDIKSLEFLSMDGSELTTLPDSIGRLEKLKQLSLRDCRLMWKLPDAIEKLTSLENLDLSSTGIDKLPRAIGNMQNLKTLKMDGSFIRKFPQSIGTLKKLEEIHASRCRSLAKIPEEIKGLSRLRILVLSHTNIRSLPESISSLSHLQNLDLYGCDNLHKVPLLPSSLAALRLTYDSSKLKSLDISNLTNLKELHLANYLEEASHRTDGNLMVEPLSLSGIGEVTKVETLKLCLSGFTTLPEMGALSQLRKLDLQCPDLQHLPQLPKSLKKLTLHDCKSLKTLPELMYLKSLSGLELLSCSVMEIQGLGNLSSLVALLISHCELVRLDGLECLTSLRTLTISYCNSLRGLPDLSNLKQLRTRNIQHCKNIPQKDSL
ncbi:disease resistance protein RPV1-like [Syzygium oleosum]|uniref:disease resistance protein RPV1-like n=1 Tax=Syzygium oleosum TaxID=219896 RepID=UPI0011D27EBF|nr:disease resistance protein RPV1-like [Syzygium oleosum]